MTDTDTPTTAPEAPEATQPTETQQEPVETFDREYVEKLRKENATYRTKAKEAAEKAEKARLEAERAKLDEVERLKAEKADVEKRAAEIEQRAVAAERRASITGKVADATAALKLLDDTKHLNRDGDVNVEALLKDYPFLAPTTPAGVSIPGARSSKTATLTEEDVKRMTPEQINARWPEVQAVLKRE